jgi:hypothetical protein
MHIATSVLFGFTLAQNSSNTGKCYIANRPKPTTIVVPTPTPKPEPQQPGLIGDCLSTLNDARARENGAPKLVWDNWLASRAQNSAKYCATVEQEHTDVVGAQILFITKTSCSDAIWGWFDRERSYNGGHYMIIKDKKYSKVGCSVIGYGSKCISCNFR